MARISDASIRRWIETDSYSELAGRLRAAGFQGWVPDREGLERAEGAFDAHGFAKDGSQWVAINYKPFPSTFWPTNGSTDDVMIRLPAEFRRDASGRESRDGTLRILRFSRRRSRICPRWGRGLLTSDAVGVDLDGDGRLGRASVVKARDSYVGGASKVAVEHTVYPQGTEFLHTVRYVGVAADGSTHGLPAHEGSALHAALDTRDPRAAEAGICRTRPSRRTKASCRRI